MSTPPASTREAPGDDRDIFTGHLPHDALMFLARRGLAEAQFRLGAAYLAGDEGVRRDVSEATQWFQRAAEQDHVEAQVHLAEAYYQGVGVDRDHEEAAHWFRAAADLGHDHAGLRLGMMYADAEAQLYIDPEARERLETAALAGYWPARHLLHTWRTEDKEAEETLDPFRHQRAR
ncbi:MAG: sel1 repeat family protein, partial [Gemmatimonadetes bacterium]|nr:sel1 repeat family protein [Gemmatimonadota bacterium]